MSMPWDGHDLYNIRRFGLTYYVRFHVPEDRIEDVGKALGNPDRTPEPS